MSNSRGEDGSPAEPVTTSSSQVQVRARARSRRRSSPEDVRKLVTASAVLAAHASGMDVPPSLLAFSLSTVGAALGEIVEELTWKEPGDAT